MEIILDANFLGEKKEAHEYLMEMLDLPDYYGHNLDALYDCLSERCDLNLVIVNSADAGEYFEKLVPIFEETCVVDYI